MVKLDIFSDPVCPWCMIGKANLNQAFAARPNHPFEIEWHPFFIEPDMPRAGMERGAYLEQKYGGRKEAVHAYSEISKAAEKAGCEIAFEAIKRMPNIEDAQRLLFWAKTEKGGQEAVLDALFDAYFRAGKDIGERDVLVDIAAAAGLEKAVIERLLSGDSDRAEIVARAAHARTRGVNSVPTFIVAEHHVLTGVQPLSLWLSVIDELIERLSDDEPDIKTPPQ